MANAPNGCLYHDIAQVTHHRVLIFLIIMHKLKARERESATLDEKPTSSVGLLNPVRAIKIGGENRGKKETTPTCDHGLSRSWNVDV